MRCNDDGKNFTETTLLYDDGDEEIIDLNKEIFKIINLNEESSVSVNDKSSNLKKRKIFEESENDKRIQDDDNNINHDDDINKISRNNIGGRNPNTFHW